MGSTFNSQILVEKLAKLNSSQASIETLSHWCIFHMNKAKQVVETWDRQFHCSPRDQRLAFLYLANDILQNSRRKSSKFFGEFWKVLPDALRDVINNGDEIARSSAQRLIVIWEDRKIFGSQGQILKDDLVGKNVEYINRHVKHLGTKLPVGNTLDKIVSGYQVVYGGPLVEDVILSKCTNAISSLEKVNKEIGSDLNAGQYPGVSFEEELQGQRAILRESIGQLTTIESSRTTLVSHMREALQEQEYKLEHIRNQLQAAQCQFEHTDSIHQQLLHPSNVQREVEEYSVEVNPSDASQSFTPGNREQSAPTMYSQQSFSEKTGHVEEDSRKSAAAAVAAKLTASASSARMLSYVLSSFASEGLISNAVKESSGDCPSEKRTKTGNDQPYVPTHNLSQFSLPFQHPQTFHHSVTTSAQQPTPYEQPPPRSSPPAAIMQPFSVPPYLQVAGSLSGVPYGYISQQQPVSLSGYSAVVPPTAINSFAVASANSFQGYQGSEGNMYSQAPSMPMAPITPQ